MRIQLLLNAAACLLVAMSGCSRQAPSTEANASASASASKSASPAAVQPPTATVTDALDSASIKDNLEAAARPAANMNLIGSVDPLEPLGCNKQGGAVVATSADDTKSLGVSILKCQDATMFWLEEMVSREPLSWRVIDVLNIPDEPDRSVLQVQDGCEYPKQHGELIAVGHWNPTDAGGNATDISRAWIVADDFSDRSFRAIPADEVTCAYEEDRE